MPQGGDAATTLDYAPPFRWSRRRVAAGAVLLALALCASGWWRWGPSLRARVNLLTLQHRCLTYQAPPDRVVFTSDPNDMDGLLRSDPSYRSLVVPVRMWHMIAANVRAEESVPTKYVWYSCDAWMRFPAGRWTPGPAYLHRRTMPKGDERLIALELSTIDNDLYFYCRNFGPMSLFADGDWSRSPRTIRGQYVIRRAMTEHVRLYAGQCDASDPCAFYIRCESGTNSATIHGRVQADGTVLLDTTAPWLQARFGPPQSSQMGFVTVSPQRQPSTQTLFSDAPPRNY